MLCSFVIKSAAEHDGENGRTGRKVFAGKGCAVTVNQKKVFFEKCDLYMHSTY